MTPQHIWELRTGSEVTYTNHYAWVTLEVLYFKIIAFGNCISEILRFQFSAVWCHVAQYNQCFRGTWCHHLQGIKVNDTRKTWYDIQTGRPGVQLWVNQWEPVALKMEGLSTEKKISIRGEGSGREERWGGWIFHGLTSQKKIISVLATVMTAILTDLINTNEQRLLNVS